jgi:serine/threonine-protein kinase
LNPTQVRQTISGVNIVFRFKLKPGATFTAAELNALQRPFMFQFYKDELNQVIANSSKYLLVTGANGIGKTSFIDAWVDHLKNVAKSSGREILAIRVSQNVPADPQIQLKRLSGYLEHEPPSPGEPKKWDVSLKPEVKISPLLFEFKGVGAQVGGGGGVAPIRVEPPLDEKAKDAKEQLIKVANEKRGFILNKKFPLVIVAIEKIYSPELIGDIAEIFDANRGLSPENSIYFVVSGGLEVHTAWWSQRGKPSALLTGFTDVYLGHNWDLGGFCEQVIDGTSLTDRSMLFKFAKYLTITARGVSRDIWAVLFNKSKSGVNELEIERYAHFYDFLVADEAFMRRFAGELSHTYEEDEYMDRLKWATCTYLDWFLKEWIAEDRVITQQEIEKMSQNLANMLPDQELRKRFVKDLTDRLIIEKYLRKRGSKWYLPSLICLNPDCRYHYNRLDAKHCIKCGTRLPVEPGSLSLSKIICRNGHQNRKDAKFCHVCGLPLGGDETKIVTRPPTRPRTGRGAQLGDILGGRYKLLKIIGQGGFGRTFLAEDSNLFNTHVAIKEVTGDPQIAEQFQFEAKVLSALKHQNIVRVTDYFTEGEYNYLVMEFVAGETLEHHIEQSGKPFPVDIAARFILQMCDVLDYLHTRTPPVIHRDVKPANIIITPDDGIVLVDFGIAKINPMRQVTATGARAVTPGYSPPEQYSSGRTDARTDIYALGATFYFLLAGVTPPEAPNRLLHEDENELSDAIKNIAPKIQKIIHTAMSIQPTKRFQSAREMKQAIEQALK